MTEINIQDVIPDDQNINLGTEEGRAMLSESIRRLGTGRSILLDKNNRLIAGNKTLEEAIKLGIVKVQVVDSDGSQLVAVKRVDMDLDSKDGRELALADNAVAKANIKFDESVIDRITEQFGLSREGLGFDKKEANLMTGEEREKYDMDNGVAPSTAVCPNCFTEFALEGEEYE